MRKLIFDTSAIFNFGKRGELEFLLKRIGETNELVTTPAVQREISDPEHLAYYYELLGSYFKIQEYKDAGISIEDLKRLSSVLGTGEISVILLALELGATAVLDEKAARNEGARLKVNVMGTLGLLNESMKLKWLTDPECLEITRRLQMNGFRIRRPGANESFTDYVKNIAG